MEGNSLVQAIQLFHTVHGFIPSFSNLFHFTHEIISSECLANRPMHRYQLEV